MNFRRYRNICGPLAMMLAFFGGTVVVASAESRMASPAQESRTAATLLRDVRMDARQVRAHAWQWATLTKSQATTWNDFDRQWNEIKPAVEDMSMKLVRLETMQPNLPTWEQKAIDGSKPLIADISSETHGLRMELDRYYNDLSNPLTPVSNSKARVLARDAGRLVRATSASTVSATTS